MVIKNKRKESGTQNWRVGKGGRKDWEKNNEALSSLALKVMAGSQWVTNSELS